MRAPIFLALCALLALGSRPAPAQEGGRTAEPRPRVGLVLSGGGARGAAHIGVLKVLDELHVPVDAIAGTSMGAVVGGLYASGMSGAEIEKLMNSVDWQSAFRDRPPRSDLSFRRKREDQDFLVQLPLGLKGRRFVLPRGLIQGQKLGLILRELTLPSARIESFDDLPIPFRAVATDLETGEAVVLKDGDLATAIRASLSVPGVFTPVEHAGRLLVDGGIAENLPIDVAREMNVDVLIVVDVGFPLGTRDRLGSVASISNQMLAILIRRDTTRQRATLGGRDIIIDPDLGATSSFDFTRFDRSIDIGGKAADASRDALARLAVSDTEFAQYSARRERVREAPPRVDFIQVAADSGRYAESLEDLFGDMVGLPLDTELLGKRVSRFYGNGTLEALDYRLVRDGDSRYGLQLSARPNGWGPNYVRVGLRLQDDFAGNSNFEAATRLVMTELNRLGAEWTWDLQVGGTPRIATAAYLPLNLRHTWFVSPRADFTVRNVPQVEDERQIGELRVRGLTYGLDFGRELGNAAEIRTGVERQRGSARVRLGDTAMPRTRFDTQSVFGRLTYDGFDNVAFPRHGQSLRLEWRGEFETDDPDRSTDLLTADARIARSFGRDTLVAWLSAGTLLDPERADPRQYFPLGGFLNLSGLPPDTLSAPHYAIARAIYYRKVGSGGEGFLNVPLYVGVSAEAGNVWAQRSQIDFSSARKNYSVFFGADTFLGPAFVAAGYDARGRSSFYLFLGRGF
ncbi:MAG: patatin-like phospholipase family protein [Steroidobacteraceae bacterium]